MDVNVRDLNEIFHFGSSLQSFLNAYIGVLSQVGSAAQQDYTQARNNFNTIRTYTESAESNLQAAERELEDAIDTANDYPEEDHSDRIEYLEAMVEEKRMVYERNKEALEEAESLLHNVKVNTDMVWEQVWRSRNQIQETGQNALRSIQKSANAIASYKK
ncbi:MAG: hypothetical protein HDS32_03630 [Bacteroides sp.]|nr:hypothetical protein [Bacteroides sp.]